MTVMSIETTGYQRHERLSSEEAVKRIGELIPVLLELEEQARQTNSPEVSEALNAVKREIESV